MAIALITGKKLLVMFILLMIGIVVSKMGIVKGEGKTQLSNILLMLVSPMVIISSYQTKYDAQLAANLLDSFLLATIGFAIVIISSSLFIRKNNSEYTIERINVIYSNGGFIGIPLVGAVLGKEGVFYLTAYLTMFNILLWTHGVILMTGKASIKTTIKNICTPSIFATIFGIGAFLVGFTLPELIAEPVQMISDLNTPLAMIVAGATLAETNVMECLKNIRIYYLTILKLIVMPLIVCAAFSKIPIDGMVKMVILIATACPAGASGTMFALRYKKNSRYASQLFAFTTILSVTTLPLMVLLMMRILHI